MPTPLEAADQAQCLICFRLRPLLLQEICRTTVHQLVAGAGAPPNAAGDWRVRCGTQQAPPQRITLMAAGGIPAQRAVTARLLQHPTNAPLPGAHALRDRQSGVGRMMRKGRHAAAGPGLSVRDASTLGLPSAIGRQGAHQQRGCSSGPGEVPLRGARAGTCVHVRTGGGRAAAAATRGAAIGPSALTRTSQRTSTSHRGQQSSGRMQAARCGGRGCSPSRAGAGPRVWRAARNPNCLSATPCRLHTSSACASLRVTPARPQVRCAAPACVPQTNQSQEAAACGLA